MKNIRSVLILFVLLPLRGNAQLPIKGDLHPRDTTQVHKLYTKRGDILTGRLLLIGVDSVSFKMNTDQLLRFSFEALDSLVALPPVRKLKPKKLVYVSERLFVAPSAFSLQKGEKEYRNILIYYNTYHIGLSDHTTIGAGFMPAVLVSAVWGDIKRTFDLNDKLHIGVGAVAALGISYDEEKVAGVGGYGVLTLGTRHNFVNLSIMRAAALVNSEGESKPWNFSIGGSFCLTPRLRLFYEYGGHFNYFFENLLILGITRQGAKRVMDAAIIAAPAREGFIIPFGLALTKRF